MLIGVSMSPPTGGTQQVPLDTCWMIMTIGSRCPGQVQPTLNPTSIWNCLDLTKGYIGLIGVYIDFCSFRYQQVLDKYYNDWIQCGEKAREELTDRHIRTGVDPATQLTKAGTPASLKEDIEVEHALDVFYADDLVETWSKKGGTGAGIRLPEVDRNAKEEVP